MTGDNRYRDGHCQNTGQGTGSTDKPAYSPSWDLVPVPYRGHRYDCPPERIWNAVDRGTLDMEFGVVDRTGIKQDTGTESHYEDAQTFHTGSKRGYQYLRMSHKPNMYSK